MPEMVILGGEAQLFERGGAISYTRLLYKAAAGERSYIPIRCCNAVCPSVCLSVCHTHDVCQNGVSF